MSTEELVERFELERVGRSSRDLRRGEAALAERPLHARDAARRVHRRPVGARTSAASPTRRLRAACAIAQEKAQTLNEVWPLIGFLLRGARDRREGLEEGDEGRRRCRCSSDALEALREVEPFEPGAIEEALAPVLAEHDVKPESSTSRSGSRSRGGSVSPGIFESLATLGKERSLRANRAELSARLDSATELRLNNRGGAADVIDHGDGLVHSHAASTAPRARAAAACSRPPSTRLSASPR